MIGKWIKSFAAVLLSFALFNTAWADRFEEIISKGVVRIGVPADVPPFGSQNVNREAEGFDVDMANMVAKALGVKLGEHNLLRWLDTFIFQTTLTGDLNKLHVKWLGGPMTAPLPPL